MCAYTFKEMLCSATYKTLFETIGREILASLILLDPYSSFRNYLVAIFFGCNMIANFHFAKWNTLERGHSFLAKEFYDFLTRLGQNSH